MATSVRGGRLVAVVLLSLTVLLCNVWSLERFVVGDGSIESAGARTLIHLLDLVLLFVALSLALRRDAWLLNAALALVAVTLTLGAFELGFRAFGIEANYPAPRENVTIRPPGGPENRAPHAFVPLSTVRMTYASNERGYFDPGNTLDHVHNSAGWRDRERTLEKPEGTLRVLGLGDSYLYGTGVRYEDGVLAKLEVGLNEALAGAPTVETINTGVPGTNTSQHRDLLRSRGWSYDPDVVVLFYVLNDVEQRLFEDGPRIDFFRNYTSVYQRPDLLSRYSRLWGWGRQRFLATAGARRYVRESIAGFTEESPGWIESRTALEDIHRQAQERGVPFLLVIFPFYHDLDGEYPFQPVHDVVRSYAEDAGIPVLDLRDSYREFRGPELWVHETDQHPNEIAHRIAADATRDFLLASLDRTGALQER